MTKNTEDVPVNDKGRKPTPKKTFSLDDFKKEVKLDKTVKFKPRKWLPIVNVLGESAFCKATGLPGMPANDVVNIIGHTDSGKSSLLLEIAYSSQKNNILPVFIITELKFAWEHLKTMGVEFTEVVDEETGEITYSGDFIFIDRSQFNTIEEMGDKIISLLNYQRDGKLPRDLSFLIDSIGTIPSEMSYTKNSQNNEWDAGAISRVFGKGVIPRINICKKDNYPYNNYMAIICQVWVRKPEVFRGLPKLAAKGGDTIPFNSTIQVVFGNVTNSGISKLKVEKSGKSVVYATRTKVSIAKNHITGISLTTKIVATPHGFIADSPNDAVAKQYFKNNAKEFMEILGGGDISEVQFTEENNEEEYTSFDDSESVE
jgi:recA bacterial DNA recombination protein